MLLFESHQPQHHLEHLRTATALTTAPTTSNCYHLEHVSPNKHHSNCHRTFMEHTKKKTSPVLDHTQQQRQTPAYPVAPMLRKHPSCIKNPARPATTSAPVAHKQHHPSGAKTSLPGFQKTQKLPDPGSGSGAMGHTMFFILCTDAVLFLKNRGVKGFVHSVSWFLLQKQ